MTDEANAASVTCVGKPLTNEQVVDLAVGLVRKVANGRACRGV